MDFASATIPEVSELRPLPLPSEAMAERQPQRKALPLGVDYVFTQRLYGCLTAVFALAAFGLFVYFAYRTCGRTGVVLASGLTFGALWSLVRFVLLC